MKPHTAQAQEPGTQCFRDKLFLLPTSLSECLALSCATRASWLEEQAAASAPAGCCPSGQAVVILLFHPPVSQSLCKSNSNPALCLVKTRLREVGQVVGSHTEDLRPPHKADPGWMGREALCSQSENWPKTQHCLHLGNVKRGREKVASEWS